MESDVPNCENYCRVNEDFRAKYKTIHEEYKANSKNCFNPRKLHYFINFKDRFFIKRNKKNQIK